MIYQEFREKFFDLGCFSGRQVYAWRERFDKNNLGRWVKQGLLIRLKPGFYCFPEYKGKPGFEFYIANRMYRPSYISLHSALAFYGMIPESVVQVTSVTTLKTMGFSNAFGSFTYQTLKAEYLFGYVPKPLYEGKEMLVADPEKALVDLLYLYPFYKTAEDMEGLRLDEDFMKEDFSFERMLNYINRFGIRTLEHRATMLLKIFSA